MNMTSQTYTQLIMKGIQGLPTEKLAEVANFIFFLRKQASDPDAFLEEQYEQLLNGVLTQLDAKELQHLEAEFAGYEARYPHE